jgi:glycosyltransferase involved in cell wall biosynthesis
MIPATKAQSVSRRLRVLQLIDHLGSGGAQTIVADLARLLPEHKIDVEVAHLFAPNMLATEFANLGTTVHDLSTGAAYRPIAAADVRPAIRLRRLLRSRDFDVVNAHLYVAPLHLKLALAGGGDRPRIINTVHAHEAHLPRYVYPSYRFTRSSTDLFVADFEASRARLSTIAGAADRVAVIPFGVIPAERAQPDDRARLRAEWDISEAAQVVLSIARLHEQRCIDEILTGFAQIVGSAPRAVLVLVGDGPQDAALRQRASKLGIERAVRFVGRRSDFTACCAAADVFVSMSVGGDVGMAALQAASTGLPVLAWDILDATIGASELDDSHPVLTGSGPEFTELLERLLDDPGLREHVGTHGEQLVRTRLNAAEMARSYAQCYRSACAPT